jgi:hypothetical protein
VAGERSTSTAQRRGSSAPRRLLGIVTAVVAVLLLSGALTSCESNRVDLDAVRNAVNASRAAAGLPALKENVKLDIKADEWAQGMRDQCRIWHSNLADGAPPEWRKLGENVGMGGSIDQVHTAYSGGVGHVQRVPHGVHRPRVHEVVELTPAGRSAGRERADAGHADRPVRARTVRPWRSRRSSS